jgi:hypothetical protein
MSPRQLFSVVSACSIIVLLSGCSVYDNSYRYAPRPIEIKVAPPQNPDQTAAGVLISVIGVRHSDQESHLPASVELRFRVENQSAQDITFETNRLALFGGDLGAFEAPIVRPPELMPIEPGKTQYVRVYFPFPRGDRYQVDLEGLSLRWALKVDGVPIEQTTSFWRVSRSNNNSRVRFNFGIRYIFH